MIDKWGLLNSSFSSVYSGVEYVFRFQVIPLHINSQEGEALYMFYESYIWV